MDPATQQMIARLHDQLQAQQAQLQQQQQHQQQLQAQLQAAQQLQAAGANASASPAPPGTGSPPAAGGAARPLVKPKPPTTFLASDKVGELDQWEREMRYQFAAYGQALAGDAARVAFAVSYLGPVPLQWWDATPAHRHVETWDEFVSLLRARFRPVHAARQARTELFKIKQGAAQSAGAYAAAFQQLLVSLPDMHVDDQVFLFVRGLSPALKRRVGDREFATLSAAINAAVQSEGLYGLQAGDEPAAGSSDHGAPTAGAAMDLHAMEERAPRDANAARDVFLYGHLSAQLIDLQEQLHAMRGGGGSRSQSSWVPGLTRKQVEERRAAGACLRCGSKSHFKADCPQKDE